MSEIRLEPVIAALLRKGFAEFKGRDHRFFFFMHASRKTSIFTKVSRGEREADDWLQRKMAQQVRLTKREFAALVDCTLSAADYAELLMERGHIT